MRVTSKMPRKQRKMQANAPLHARHRMVSCHLERQLMNEYNTRSVPVRKGDTVKIIRGSEGIKGVEAKVSNVDLRSKKLTLDGITIAKADGTQKARPVDPSNCIITKLDLSDPVRKAKLEKLKEGAK
ncbi:MAG: 50S ribosomal protein L24 [Thermoplasmata archaeon]